MEPPLEPPSIFEKEEEEKGEKGRGRRKSAHLNPFLDPPLPIPHQI